MAVDPRQYYVAPLGGLGPQIAAQAGDIAGQYAQKRESVRAQENIKSRLSDASELMRSGNPEAMADFFLKNPDLRQSIIDAQQFKNEATKAKRVDSLKRILVGENLQDVVSDTSQFIRQQGGDPSETEAFGRLKPEQAKQAALAELALMAPDLAKSFLQTSAGQEYTLSEGQARFKDGELVAYMPKTIDEAERESKKLEKQLKLEKTRFDKAAKIRGEVEKATKVFRDVEDSYSRVKASGEGEITGASDLALIFNFMKMLDPGSVVREGEFANAQNAEGVDGKIRNAYNRLLNGERLNPSQRKKFIAEAKKQFDSAESVNNKRLSDFERLGKRFGLERGDIILSEESEPQSIEDLVSKYAD